MEYVFPTVFHANEDGSYTITFPDLPGCISEGKSLGNALHMAQSALKQWIKYLLDKNIEIPSATPIHSLITESGEFPSLIYVEIKEERAVKRTVSIPKWMDEKAIESGLSLSHVLQDALNERLTT